jgi:hypothetical protein
MCLKVQFQFLFGAINLLKRIIISFHLWMSMGAHIDVFIFGINFLGGKLQSQHVNINLFDVEAI